MRFTRVEVEGFGILHDTVIEELGPGLTVIGGANGAGKSSLHAFLTRTLFGIPRSNAVEVTRHFEPLRGGRQGGVVHVADVDGAPWRIRRIKGGNPTLEVEGPNGTSTSSDALRPLLGDLDRDRFEALFAIDLERLVGMEDLPGEQLQQLLFDAAVLGTAGSLRGARELATERAEALYKANGRIQPIAETRRERREVEEELREARARVTGLEERRDRIADAEERRAALAEEIEELTREASIIDRVKQAWPRHRDARDARARAAELDGADVPEDLRQAIEEARTGRDAAAARIDALDAELADVRAELASTTVDEAVLAQAAAIEQLAATRPVHEDREQRHAAAVEQHRREAAAADEAVARIGPSWTPAAVERVAVDGAAVDRVQAAAAALSEAQQAHAQAREQHTAATDELERKASAVERRAADLPDALSDEELQRASEAVTALRTHLPVLEQAEQRASVAGGAAPGQRAPVPAGMALAVVAVGGLVLVAAVVLSEATVGVIGGLLAAVGAYLVGLARDRRAGGQGTPPGTDVAELRELVADAAAALDLPARPDLGQLTRAEAWLQRQGEAAAARRADERALAEARHELADAEELAEQRKTAVTASADALAAARTELRTVCDEIGLEVDADLEPAAVTGLHARVREAANALGAVATAAAHRDELAEQLAGFRDEAAAVCAAVGREGLDGAQAVQAIPALREDLEEARAARDERGRLAAAIEELTEDRAAAAEQLADHRRALVEAREMLGVDSEDDVDAVMARHDERAEAVATARQAEADIDTLLGEGPGADRARELLDEGDVAGWDAQLDRVRDERAELQDERDALLEQRTLLEKELEELGGDDTIPQLSLQVELLQEQLNELTRRWAVLEVARTVLDAAVDHFESQQQPVVLETASQLFSDFTHGDWAEVRQVDRLLYARRPGDGGMVTADQLSTGEQAQLYLALRVALATHRGGNLPLLLDDLLQSADDERATAICATLASLAQERQILLFTPSQRMLEATLAAVPGAGHVLLDDGAVVASEASTVPGGTP